MLAIKRSTPEKGKKERERERVNIKPAIKRSTRLEEKEGKRKRKNEVVENGKLKKTYRCL